MDTGKLFLPRLFKRNKLLFYCAIFFILGQGFFTYKGVETIPFFNFGMYSEVYTLLEEHKVIAIYLDTTRIDKQPKSRFPLGLVIETLDYFQQLNERNFSDTILITINKRFKNRLSEDLLNKVIEQLANDSADKLAYQEWAFNFIKSFYHEDALKLRVEVERYKFVDNRLNFIGKDLLFEYGSTE